MNNNALISASVLNAYWSQSRRDTLDLLMPFLKFSIDAINRLGEKIDLEKTVEYFKTEYGYENIPINVIYVMLNRLSPKYVRRENKQYIWKESFDKEIADYKRKRLDAKEKREKVIGALNDHLCSNLSRKDYNSSQTMDLLYSFFVENGLYVAKDITELGGIRLRDGKVNYEIARFITNEYREKSALFDYIVEMVNGFFMSTAISIQNVNSTAHMARIKDMSCYIDTRIIINALGLHLVEARKSATEFLEMLKGLGAKLFCFSHNYSEICDVLNAYKNCLSNPRSRVPFNTLEALDEQGYTPYDVERYVSRLPRLIELLGISIVDAPPYDEASTSHSIIDESGLKDHLLTNINYNVKAAVETDVASASAIMRLRKGVWPRVLEKSKFIFVSTNNKYARLVAQFLKQPDNTVPCVMGDMDLSAIIWLKSYQVHRDYPKSKLIENAMMALEPSPQFINIMFEQLNKLQFEGILTSDEVAILRTDIYAKRQAMQLSQGDSSEIDGDMLQSLRDSLRSQYVNEEHEISSRNYQLYMQEKKKHSEIRKRSIDAIYAFGEETQSKIKRKYFICVKVLIALIFIIFVACIVYSISTGSMIGIIVSVILGVIDIFGFCDLLFSKWRFISNWITKKATQVADEAMDKKRDEYETLIGNDT